MPGIYKKFSNNGFTLIELLVAISVLSIIFGVGLTSSAMLQKWGRDVQRQADLSRLQAALQQYHSDYHSYPINLSNLTSGTKKYLSTGIPQDPRGSNYSFEPKPAGCNPSGANKCTTYCLYATLENPPSPAINFSSTPCTNPGANNYFVASP